MRLCFLHSFSIFGEIANLEFLKMHPKSVCIFEINILVRKLQNLLNLSFPI